MAASQWQRRQRGNHGGAGKGPCCTSATRHARRASWPGFGSVCTPAKKAYKSASSRAESSNHLRCTPGAVKGQQGEGQLVLHLTMIRLELVGATEQILHLPTERRAWHEFRSAAPVAGWAAGAACKRGELKISVSIHWACLARTKVGHANTCGHCCRSLCFCRLGMPGSPRGCSTTECAQTVVQVHTWRRPRGR